MLLYSTDSAVRPGYAGVPPAGTPWGRRHPARRHTLGARASRPQRPGVRGRPRPQARPGCAGVLAHRHALGARASHPQARPGGAGVLARRHTLGARASCPQAHPGCAGVPPATPWGVRASSPAGTPWVRRRPRPQACPGYVSVLARWHTLGTQASHPLARPGHAGVPPAWAPWVRGHPRPQERSGCAGVSLVCAFPTVNRATLRCIIKQPEDGIACRITVLRLTPVGFR